MKENIIITRIINGPVELGQMYPFAKMGLEQSLDKMVALFVEA